ncbi:TrkA family potassium uptake protein [Halorhabdus sp. CBA1104]|uniref:potassium channel family protein n=1 Tax=unclassified Halorhabdus TaxID=2621901 RepID=UPI0012B42795|nr:MULTISPECIES: NAD-binding protein [unclassified Halorhabdus]QGN07730.1 TrkA family potassium uptake protein [Halorhabdus sp. CBA1104]
MKTWQRRTVGYAAILAVVILVFAVLYQQGMAVYDGRPRTFLESVQFVVETFTTTGYGADSPWNSAVMTVYVIFMDLAGVVLIVTALPVLAIPLLEELLETTVPERAPDGVTDHVIICTYTSRAEALIDELSSWDVPYLILEPDRQQATALSDAGYRVVNADPETAAGLEAANLAGARALVADVSDAVDASIVLAAGEVDADVPVISVLEEPGSRPYHRLAGADEVLSPRPLLGQSLAAKVTTSLDADLGDAVEIGEDFELVELPLQRGSPLVGSTLADSGIREDAGGNVIGAWFDGEFQAPPDPGATLTNGTVLLVAGHERDIERLREHTLADVRRFGDGETIVVGYGEVGQTIVGALDAAGLPFTVVDQEAMDGVDVVGDAVDPETLRAAGIDDARSVILALPDDTTTQFATLVVRDLSPTTEVIARVEEPRNVKQMYRAGADYVLALATVSGRMIASAILDDEAVLSVEAQIQVVRTAAPGLVGTRLGEARVRSKTGCTVVGVGRENEILTDVGPDVRIEDGDELVIAGTDEGIRAFNERFG